MEQPENHSGPDTQDLISTTTFIVKTFMRPACLDRLITSIHARYPDARILVADDGPDPQQRTDAQVYELPYDMGLSFGRNHLVDHVQTDHFVLMDDDHVFTDDTLVERLLTPLISDQFDLVGAQVVEAGGPFHWEGLMDQDGTSLTMRPGNRGTVAGVQIVDFCHNFFAAKTGVVKNLRWDDALKLGEHTDFFLRAKTAGVRVGYCPQVEVFHAPEKATDYAVFRQRAKEYRLDMMQRHGLRRIENLVFPGGSLDLDAISR